MNKYCILFAHGVLMCNVIVYITLKGKYLMSSKLPSVVKRGI